MEDRLLKMERDLADIKQRNSRVEADKAWETSLARSVIIAIITYLVIVTFFWFADISRPLINAIVPALAFLLSTLTLSFGKKYWIKNHNK
ncbi:MAG: hypothetical protein Q8P90_05340 [bacterium]|nr:hypothetical protein [bacterium]